MTRKEAKELVDKIASGAIPLERTDHFLDEMGIDGFGMQDVFGILRTPSSMSLPKFSEEHQNFKVEVVGNDMDGQRSRVVLGLRADGPCVGITVMPAHR